MNEVRARGEVGRCEGTKAHQSSLKMISAAKKNINREASALNTSYVAVAQLDIKKIEG